MMELTKDNVVITSDGDIFIPVIGFRDIKSRLPQGKELKQQIVDDCEKARKYEEHMNDQHSCGTMDIQWEHVTQNQKLCELIEKREKECRTNSNKINFAEQFKEYSYQERVGIEFEKLLTESKK